MKKPISSYHNILGLTTTSMALALLLLLLSSSSSLLPVDAFAARQRQERRRRPPIKVNPKVKPPPPAPSNRLPKKLSLVDKNNNKNDIDTLLLYEAPPQFDPQKDLYPYPGTVFRSGPVPLLVRLTNPEKYLQAMWRYMYETKTDNFKTAQGNADAFFASPEVWAEQKLLEQQGRVEPFDYGKDPPLERVILSSIWGVFVTGLIGRVIWQLIHGNRNLF